MPSEPVPFEVTGDDGATVLSAPLTAWTLMAPARIPSKPWHPGHRGIDMSATVGDPVLAPAAGTVTFAGYVVSRPVMTVTHADGLVSSFEPVTTHLEVGAVVMRGDAVGQVANGDGHCAPTTCVHWGVREHGDYINPLDVLANLGPIRLLEVG